MNGVWSDLKDVVVRMNKMSQPNQMTEELDYHLKGVAGLQMWEKDDGGIVEWVGTEKAWSNYRKLLEEFEKENEDND